MNHLDDLRDALDSPPDFAPRPMDLVGVMAAGGRIRRRRRVLVGTASAVTVGALLAGVPQLVRSTGSGPSLPAASRAVSPSPSPGPPSNGFREAMLGDVIRTGLPTQGGEWVIWAMRIDHPAAGQPSGVITGPPDTVTFGFMLGVRSPDGELDPVVMTNETEGSDRAGGFHALDEGVNVNGRDTLPFGYYVGPAEKITSNGHPAELSTWSEDDTVKVFWLQPGQVPGAFKAYDADGRQLPGGRNSGP